MRCTVGHVLKDAHEEGAWSCCWVPRTRSFLTGAVDETVKLWSVAEDGMSIEKTFQGQAGHTLGVISVGVDPTGEWAASSALDSYIRVWSLKDLSQERALLESKPTEVWSIAFSPATDKCIVAAAGGITGKIKLWDITAMSPGVKTAPPDPELIDVVRCTVFCRHRCPFAR
jgi:WD repeat-containing protein 61